MKTPGPLEWMKFDRIPPIKDCDLLFLAEHIRPLYWDDDRLRFVLPPGNRDYLDWLKNASFIWDPELDQEFCYNRQVGSIITYHSFGAPSFFKPNVAECISQIVAQVPPDWFPIITGFALDADLDRKNVLSDGYHFTRCFLYETFVVKDGKVIARRSHHGNIPVEPWG